MAATSKSTGRTTPKGTGSNTKKPVTSAREWKSSSRTPVELELPSGNVCLAINKGMKVFLQEGNVPNSLMGIVQGAIDGAEGGKTKQKFQEAGDDPKLIGDMMHLMDALVVTCVREPVIMPVPKKEDGTWDEAAKDPDLLYIDDVDMEDKMFIFQWCVGGTSDVEQFRKEYAANLASLSSGESVEQEAK